MKIIIDINDESARDIDSKEGIKTISDTQARVAEIFVFLDKQLPGNYFEVTKSIIPNCKPDTLRKLVAKRYLKTKTVTNIYGEKVTLYCYSGKPFPHISDYPFIPKKEEY